MTGHVPIVVGASLGGLSGLIAGARDPDCLSALVLVDITPHVKADGVERILGFMAEKSEVGFDSLQSAADAIAAYLPHRPKPASLAGSGQEPAALHSDGRYRWHWDPAFPSIRVAIRMNTRQMTQGQKIAELAKTREGACAAGARPRKRTGRGRGNSEAVSGVDSACRVDRCERRPPHGCRRPATTSLPTRCLRFLRRLFKCRKFNPGKLLHICRAATPHRVGITR